MPIAKNLHIEIAQRILECKLTHVANEYFIKRSDCYSIVKINVRGYRTRNLNEF